MTMKSITLADAFRAILRAMWPQRPALVDEIQSSRYFHDARWCHCRLRRIDLEAQAADDALAVLRDAIVSQSIRLRGWLGDNLPADIEHMEVAWNGIHVFDNTLEVYGERGRTLRTYRNVHCYAADIATLIGAAENDAAVDDGARPGIQTTVQAKAESACGEFLKTLPKKPRIRKEDLEKTAREMFQGLSGRAFGRQWDLHIHSEWKAQGALQKTPQQ
jgi:hypothetical protein